MAEDGGEGLEEGNEGRRHQGDEKRIRHVAIVVGDVAGPRPVLYSLRVASERSQPVRLDLIE